MKTIIEAGLFPICPSSGAKEQSEFMMTTTTTTPRDISPHRSRSNSNHSERDSLLSDYIFIPSSPSSISLIFPSNTSSNETNDDTDYLNEFICPSDSDDESRYFYDNDNNDELFLENHLSKQKFDYIKTKHAKSIKIKSHNKHLYMHHRLAKNVLLDKPSYHCIPSSQPVPLYSSEALRSIVYQLRHPYDSSYNYYSTTSSSRKPRQSKISNQTYIDESQLHLTTHQYRDYTLNEYNIPDELSYDDAMINFLLDMQNRDLSPEDYEMLLRLDERVQRRTLNTNVLNTLPTIDVNQTHLDDQCTICMEKYNLGQQLKLLPCTHIFHLNCIEIYLKDFSIQCPLDNLPLI